MSVRTSPARTALAVGSALLVAALAGCGDDSSGPSTAAPQATVTVTETTTASSPSPSPSPSMTSPPSLPASGFPCDPGGGYPKPSDSCPYGNPTTGDVLADDGTTLQVKPFHTYYNDAEGKAYAKKHHLRYPFDDDHYDAPAGPVETFSVTSDTICTGIISVGKPSTTMQDHLVKCSAFDGDHGSYGIPAAIWLDGDHLVQLSELFRP